MPQGTNKKLVRNMAAVIALDQDNVSLGDINKQISRARREIPAALGTGFERSTGGSAGAGAGIISPVTEANAATRTFFAIPRQITSTDGVFEIEIRDLQTIDMEDAADNEVQFVFAQPS